MKKPILNKAGEARAFFGRRSGKHLGGAQKALYDEILPKLEIKIADDGALEPKILFPKIINPKKIILEIGYGGGEHIARKALENPNIAYIGCEVFSGGIGKLLDKIDKSDIKNIRLYSDDAIKLLAALAPNSIDEIYLLYPDPWPKTRHNKRRFVSLATLDAMAEVLKPDGLFHFATDIEDYANWTLAFILRHDKFHWNVQTPNSWHQPYVGWQATRYEKKARKQGRNISYYFSFEYKA